MPGSANVTIPLVPPSPSVSDLTDEDIDQKGWKDSGHKEQGRTSSSEWIDVDEDKPRRRRKVKRTSSSEVPKKQSKPQDRRSVSNELGRFLPRLSQILETNEPKSQPRPRSGESRTYTRNDSSPAHRRSARTRENDMQRQQESLLQFNASLLSVISGLTTSTDRSSGSNSTVTQRSYKHRHGNLTRRPHRGYQRPVSEASSVMSSPTMSQVSYEYPGEQEEKSVISSSPSSRHHSEIDSSDAPGTPSSRSTYPSPAVSYNSVPDRHTTSPSAVSSAASSVITESELSGRSESTFGQPSLIDGQYYYREPDPPHAFSVPSAQDQEPLLAPMPAHPSAFFAQNFEDMQRSRSHSSASSDHIGQRALQHYHARPLVPGSASPRMQAPLQQDALDSRPPTAPEAPSIGERTIAGYEKLALELASSTSPVKPLYRKFEFLNHRLLLQLQDELAELEEQLRRIDEAIAHMEPGESKPLPASRRGEAYYGAEIHYQRTVLLGRIFIKAEQYNKAMSSYSNMVRDCAPANPNDIKSYRSWMAKETPVHEIEARFLTNAADLVMPGGKDRNTALHSTVVLLCCTILMLPPALFAIIPSVLGRLVMVLTLATIIVLIRTTTSLLPMLSLWEMIICVTAFVLLMTIVALFVPLHAA